MNVLFALYGGFDCNSGPFIAAYANELTAMGHDTVIAASCRLPDDLRDYDHATFRATDHVGALQECPFANGRSADILHAWTPRETVRRFCVTYAQNHACRVVVHMEDNEERILSVMAGKSFDELSREPEGGLDGFLSPHFAHPRRYRLFLDYADAATVVWPSLGDFLPKAYPVLHLPVCAPMHDAEAEAIRQPPHFLGAVGDEKIMVYSGGLNPVSLPDQRKLYEAVVALNQRGIKCRLLRTGPEVEGTSEFIFPGSSPFVTELGFLSREELHGVMRLAHVFVQPGTDDEFNRYRLPCKIPEFLALGCPMILPRANFGGTLRDGLDALLLHNGSPEEIADKCETVFADAALSNRLAASARVLAAQFFDLRSRARELEEFYLELVKLKTFRQPRSQSQFSEKAFLAAVAEQARGRGDAQALDRVVDQLSMESRSDPTVCAEVHACDCDGEFPPGLSRRRSYPEGGSQCVEFSAIHQLETPNSPDLLLRLRPVDRPGEFTIHRLALVHEQSGEILQLFHNSALGALRDLVLVDEPNGIFLACGYGATLMLPPFRIPGDDVPCKLVMEISTQPGMLAPPSRAVVLALAEAAATSCQLEQAKRHIQEIESSRCWKATAPYRSMASALANIWRSKKSATDKIPDLKPTDFSMGSTAP